VRGRRRPAEPWRQRAREPRDAGTNGAPEEGAETAPSTPEAPRATAFAPLERAPVPIESLSPEATAPPRPERRRGLRFNIVTGTLLLSAIALGGGFLIMNLVLMPSFTRQGSEVPVPEVTGLSEREAERVLASEDLRLSKVSEQWSADVPRGFVSAQDPPSGGLVKRGRRISVIVSLGAQGTSVPVLDGTSERQAGILLESAGLRRGKVARVYTDDIGKDLVIASDPPGETLVEQETVVDLLVSLGPPSRDFVLPDLTGRSASEVARGLRDEGFMVTLHESPGASDIVSGQDPSPGHRVAPRDSIVLYVKP
jgi:beta-lactam-binding protein with PASTA domain